MIFYLNSCLFVRQELRNQNGVHQKKIFYPKSANRFNPLIWGTYGWFVYLLIYVDSQLELWF